MKTQMQTATPPQITLKLIELQNMSVPALQAKFKELYGFPTNQSKPETLRRRLAYRIQELYYGGLTDKEGATLDKLADDDKLAMLKRDSAGEVPLMPGARLVRVFKGKRHEVTVMTDGRFEYGGRIFRSLSAIATEISGSHWNGKIFFKVK